MDTERSAFSVDSAAGASVSEKRMVSNYCLCDVYDSIRTIRGGNRGGGASCGSGPPFWEHPNFKRRGKCYVRAGACNAF